LANSVASRCPTPFPSGSGRGRSRAGVRPPAKAAGWPPRFQALLHGGIDGRVEPAAVRDPIARARPANVAEVDRPVHVQPHPVDLDVRSIMDRCAGRRVPLASPRCSTDSSAPKAEVNCESPHGQSIPMSATSSANPAYTAAPPSPPALGQPAGRSRRPSVVRPGAQNGCLSVATTAPPVASLPSTLILIRFSLPLPLPVIVMVAVTVLFA
jgi:hypothetical protein